MIALILVSAWALALVTAGPKAFGAIPSQALLLASAAYLTSKADRAGLNRLLVGIAAWTLAIVPCAVINGETIGDILQILRSLAIIPGAALILGFAMVRSDRRTLFVALCVSAAASCAAMLFTATSSAQTQIMEHGHAVRVFGNILTDELITATGATANCLAGFLLAGWVVSKSTIPIRLVSALMLAGALGVGLVTGTRAPVLATAMVFALHFGAELIQNRNAFGTIAAMIGASIVAFAALFLIPSHQFVFLERFTPEALLDRTFSGRSDIWLDRWRMIEARPIGYGQLEMFGFDTFSSHNLFLEMAYLAGVVPGIVATVALLSVGAFAFFTLATRRGDAFSRCLSAGVLIALLFSMFESTVSSCYQAFTWTLVIVGAFLGYERKTDRRTEDGGDVRDSGGVLDSVPNSDRAGQVIA